jgi:hypothetical protein
MFSADRAVHSKVYKWIQGTVERRATMKAASESALPESLQARFKPHIVHSWSVDPDYQVEGPFEPPAMDKTPKGELSEIFDMMPKGGHLDLAGYKDFFNSYSGVGPKANEAKPRDPSKDGGPDELGLDHDETPPATSKTIKPKDSLRKNSSAPKVARSHAKTNPVARNSRKPRREAAKINVFESQKSSTTETKAKRKAVTDLRDDGVESEGSLKNTRKPLRRKTVNNVNKKAAAVRRG